MNEIKTELNKILDTLKSELKYVPYLYGMDIHLHDDFRTPPVLAVCWRQWTEFEKKKTDEFTTITLQSERQCVEIEYDGNGIQTNYPIGVLKLAIEFKLRNYPEPCKDIVVDWERINKCHTSRVCFPIGTTCA